MFRFTRIALGLAPALLLAQPADLMTSRFVKADFALKADPTAAHWRTVKGIVTQTERWGKPVPNARTEIRSVWTPENLYFLFISNFETQHLTPKPDTQKETWGIWDYDVVEVFIGHDLKNINLYKEFEVTPQSEWVDLDVDKGKASDFVNWKWDSHFKFHNRVDKSAKIWYCEMQIPWKSIAAAEPQNGQEFRLNLYRIEGSGDSRKYIAWRPVNNPSYHTPERFGRLILAK
jgi:hypothetical protein